MGQLRNEIAIQTLAGNVKKYRKEKLLTQEKLANEVGIEYSQVSRIERGVLNTSISVIFELAKALDIEPELLLKR